jgi:hypothetical protein
MQKNNRLNNKIYDFFVFVTIIFSLIFTSTIVTSNAIKTDHVQIGIIKNDPNINFDELRRTSPYLMDDVCDDCDDDDGPAVNQQPVAFIHKVEPNPAHEYESILFEGYGEDTDGTIEEYLWQSDIDDTFNTEPIFSFSGLSSGSHIISFFVKDDDEEWSIPSEIILEILANMAPNPPIIAGLANGKIGEENEYDFVTTDPEEHDVLYYVEWGDGEVEEWIGPYASNEVITVSHIWKQRGAYTIQSKAKDIHGEESNWGTLEVQMPRSRFIQNELIQQIISRIFSKFSLIFD